MPVPTRNQLSDWKPDTAGQVGAVYANVAAGLRAYTDNVTRIVHEPGDTGTWEGTTRLAAEDRAISEATEVAKLAQAVEDLANSLGTDGTAISDLVRDLMNNAAWAEGEGFIVSDVWLVSDSSEESDATRSNTMANWQAVISSLGTSLGDSLDGMAQRIRSALADIEVAAPIESARLPAGFQLEVSGLSPSRQRAVAYADDHATRYNPNYPSYEDDGTDCTNFVSQTLEAGGFQQSMSRDRLGDPNDDDPKAWFSQHDDNTFTEDWEASRTWTYAPALHEYLTEGHGSAEDGAPTGTAVPTSKWTSPSSTVNPNSLSESGLQPGDAIFYEHNGEIAHAGVYAGKDWIELPDGTRTWGDVVDTHTSNRKHEPWYLPSYGEDGYSNFPITYHPVKVNYPDDDPT